jgi:hypothetical protein
VPTSTGITAQQVDSLEKEFATVAKVGGSQVAGVTVVGGAAAANNIVPFARQTAETLQGAANAAQTPVSLASVGMLPAMGFGLFGHIANAIGNIFEKVTGVIPSNPIKNGGAAVQGGLSAIGDGSKRIGDMLNAPFHFLQKTKINELGDIGKNVSTATSKGAEKAANFIGTKGKMGENISRSLTDNLPKVAGAEKAVAEKVGGFVGGAGKHINGAAENVGNFFAAKGATKLGANITSAPAAIGKAVGKETLYSASYTSAAVLGAAAQNVSTFHLFQQKLDQVCDLHADMTNTPRESVNMMKLMFAKTESLPPIVAQARNEITSRIGPAALMSAVSNVVAYKAARYFGGQSAGNGMMGSMALMGLQMKVLPDAMKMVIPNNPMLDIYSHLKQEYAATGAMSQQACAAILVAASPSLAHTSVNNVYVQELAKTYADGNTTPAMLMNEIQDGTIAAKTYRLSEKIEAQKLVTKAPANNIVPFNKVETTAHQGMVKEPQLTMGVS